MSDQNPNKPDGFTSKDSFQSMRELILWKLNNLQGGTRLTYQQYWRARVLLATMSVGFLGICLTGQFNLEDNFMFLVTFWGILVGLFYTYDCHVNSLLVSHQEKSKELGKELYNLENNQNYDNLKKKILLSIHDEREIELKKRFCNSRLHRFFFKLKLGLKLEMILYYSIISLILAASILFLIYSPNKSLI